jgi:hypothetical protein
MSGICKERDNITSGTGTTRHLASLAFGNDGRIQANHKWYSPLRVLGKEPRFREASRKDHDAATVFGSCVIMGGISFQSSCGKPLALYVFSRPRLMTVTALYRISCSLATLREGPVCFDWT